MARTTFVKARRVGKKGAYELRCNGCGQPIEIGQPYKWFKMKTTYGGIKRSYHPDCEIPPSHRTSSRMGEIYDAQATLGKDLEAAQDFDGIREALEAFSSVVREVGEGYTESADNMEEGFGHETYQSQEIRERAEGLESWADEIDSWDFSGDEPDQDDFKCLDQEAYDEAHKAWEDEEPSVDESEEDEDELASQQSEHDDWEASEPSESEYEIDDEEAFKEALDEVLDEARSEAQDVADNCPV